MTEVGLILALLLSIKNNCLNAALNNLLVNGVFSNSIAG